MAKKWDEKISCPARYHCNTDEGEGECDRDSLFPLKPIDYIGMISLSILMSLTTAAGLGGGEIIVPTIIILFQFQQSDTAPLSQCCIMIAGITRFMINYKKKHPYRNAVAIDYNAAMILMPCIFLGSSMGIMLHHVLPELIQSFILLLVLVYCVYESATKGIKFWRQESAEKLQNEGRQT